MAKPSSGTPAAAKPASGKPTSVRLADFSVELPDGWSGQVLASGPLEGGFRPNLVAVAIACEAEETAAAFAQRMLPQIRANALQYQLVREGPASFGAVSGHLREHTFFQSGARVGQLQLYVVEDALARIFTFTHLAARLEAARPQADALFATIRVFHTAHNERLRAATGQMRG